MKIYRNLVQAVADTLQEIFIRSRYADKALEKAFKSNPKWGGRDRRFIAEAVYDIVRNYRLYSQLAQSEKNFWFMTAVWMILKEIEMPDWQEFKHVDAEFILKTKERLKHHPAVYESYPDWIWEMGIKELGEEKWIKEATSMNTPAPVVLRVNTLKTNNTQLLEEFNKKEIFVDRIHITANGFELKKRENLFATNFFKDGWFEVQDAGSQLISEFVAPSSNDYVIDACAGAGGKSLHLAALMNNKGKIVSMDIEAFKLEELKKRAKRAGAFNIETRPIEDPKTIKKLENRADKVLLDVPCSGLGVIRRNPDAKWKLSEASIVKTKTLQQSILNEYCSMVKPGGKLIYSTCSILPSENNEQVEAFLNNHKEFSFVKDKMIFPSEGYDGFYMCELKKEN